MQDIPPDDPATYDMICAADTVGVFQIESRAQMSMLPRLKPRRFYDLVIEVAIVRPGPIQGGMVHPYLQRREEQEPVDYPSPDMEKALERTLGVPIFQEQVMQVAILAAGFTPGEADQLRRAMAAWKRKGGLEKYYERIVGGMLAARLRPRRSPSRSSARSRASANTAFPESHAASFALLAYASSWLKCHEPAAFLCALLNSQPMGFYSPSQLVQDARRHGVEVRPVDVDGQRLGIHAGGPRRCRRAPAGGAPGPAHAARDEARRAAERIELARAIRPFASVADLARRADLDRGDLQVLAGGNALVSAGRPPAPGAVAGGGRRAGQGPAAPDHAGRGHAGAGRAAARARRSSATTARRA